MTRSILLSAALILLSAAATSHAAVTYNGYRVTVQQVGAIDASPCPNPDGCLRGVVEIRYRGETGTRLVRCAHPTRLHVKNVIPTRKRPVAVVFACGRDYLWRLPR